MKILNANSPTLLHVPWPRPPARRQSAPGASPLDDRAAFLALASRRGTLIDPARRLASSGQHW